MDKVLWVKFGWSDYYRGAPVYGDFSALAGTDNVGHEAYNFEPAPDGTYYCYVLPQAGCHAPSSRDKRGWTVVCLAKHPKRTGIHIVGWYEDATLLGRLKNVPETCAQSRYSDPPTPDEAWLYCITSNTAYFVHPERRTPDMSFSHPSVGSAHYMYLRGPEIQATTPRKKVLKLLKHRMKKLQSSVIKNPTEETAPDLGAEPGDPLRGFGTPEHRKKVEKAAEEAVKSHYREKGFFVHRRYQEKPRIRLHLQEGTDQKMPCRSKGYIRRPPTLLHDPQRKCLPKKSKVEICNRYECVGPGSDGSCLQQSTVQEDLRA